MVEEQLLVQQQQNKIYGRIQVTPQMVRDFYAQIPTDSLPYLPAEVEISQIILKPTPSETNKQAARARLAGILADVKAGTITFQDAARRFSQDRGSAEQAGFLGQLTRGDVVPEFAAEVFNLQPNQLSDVFESPFGFHVALLHKREGDIVTVSHILIKPIVDTQDEQRCRERLAQIRTEIEAGRISFEEAARQYSEDRRTKDAGGQMSDQVSGSYRIPIDQLDADLYLKLDQLQEGQVSEPLEVLFQDLQLTRAYQLVYLRKRYQPHRASLESDYEKFYNATKQAQQAQALEDWLQRNRRTIYHQIKAEQCRQALQGWD
jgi:peptidyl-prolyl cis-trans isomerase SurA